MAPTKTNRARLPLTLTDEEAASVFRAAKGAGLKPATWARAEVLKAAARAEPAVVARAQELLKAIEKGVPGGKRHADEVERHRREGWARGRR